MSIFDNFFIPSRVTTLHHYERNGTLKRDESV